MTQMSISDLTVLLIEPSCTQAKIIQQVLQEEGVSKLDIRKSGADALTYLSSYQPDLVISAMYFEDMTAIELLHNIRKDESLHHVNFMLVSSETSFDMIDPIKQAGVLAVLPKPFDRQSLHRGLLAARDTLEVKVLDIETIDIDDLRCLVVDDSLTARRHISRMLNSCGVENILEAENGQEAIETLGREGVDFVITDYNMPVMNGEELVKYIAQSEFSYLPVLMVTSEAEGSRLSAVRQAGVCALFDKTIDPGSLRATLSHALSGA